MEGNFDYRKLAKCTPGFVGADLQGLVSAAGIAAIKRIFGLILSNKPENLPSVQIEQIETQDETQDEAEESRGSEDVDMKEINGNTSPSNSKYPDVASEVSQSNDVTSVIEKFLLAHPNPLSEEELEPLAVTFEDFTTALPTIQPSSKREGFATVPDVTWDDVGALERIREELEYAIVEPIRDPDLYKSVGVNAPSGVLLWGPLVVVKHCWQKPSQMNHKQILFQSEDLSYSTNTLENLKEQYVKCSTVQELQFLCDFL